MPRAFLAARSKSKDYSEESDDENDITKKKPEQAALFKDFQPEVAGDDDTGHNTRAAKRRKQHRQQQMLKQQQQQMFVDQQQHFQDQIRTSSELQEMAPKQDEVHIGITTPFQIPPIHKWITDAEGKQKHVYECSVCGKVFSALYTLQRHLPTHTGEKKFECNVCHKRFSQSSTLYRHRAIHSSERPFHCNICNKAFNRRSTLISHAQIHSDVRPHKCSVCNKSFHQKGNLRIHMNTHMDVRPYQCSLCDRGFNQQSNLSFHMAQAHTDNNRMSCHLCGDHFRKKYDLRKHELKVHGVSNKEELEAWQRKKASGDLCEQVNTTNTITLPNGDKTIRFNLKRLGLDSRTGHVSSSSSDKAQNTKNTEIVNKDESNSQIDINEDKTTGNMSDERVSEMPCQLVVDENQMLSDTLSGKGNSDLSADQESQQLQPNHGSPSSLQQKFHPIILKSQISRKLENSNQSNVVTPAVTGSGHSSELFSKVVSSWEDTNEEPQIGRKIATFVRVPNNSKDTLKSKSLLDSDSNNRPMIAMISQGEGGNPLLVKMLPLSTSLFRQPVLKGETTKLQNCFDPKSKEITS